MYFECNYKTVVSESLSCTFIMDRKKNLFINIGSQRFELCVYLLNKNLTYETQVKNIYAIKNIKETYIVIQGCKIIVYIL